MVLCFDCNGKGKIENKVFNKDTPVIITDCEMCGGYGTIPDRQVEWILQGMKLKDSRLNQDIALRKAARLLKVEQVFLSHMERGIVEPWLEYDFSEN